MRTPPTTRSDHPAASPPFLLYLLPVVIVSLLTVATNAEAQTILNVERLQPGDVDGWHWGLEGEFSLSRENSEYVDLFSGVVGGHRWTDHWLRVHDRLRVPGALMERAPGLPLRRGRMPLPR